MSNFEKMYKISLMKNIYPVICICICLVLVMNDDDEALSVVYQVVSELHQPNRDALAFMILHLQRYTYVKHTQCIEGVHSAGAGKT